VTVVLALVVQISFAASRATDVVAPESLNKASERIAVKKAHGRGTLIDVHTGGDGQLTVIAVHGIAGQPSDLSPLIQKAIHAGHTVKAFAYDDKFLSLEDSSLDLAVTIEQWWNAHPTSSLRIDAHSMGGRVAIGSLAILSSKGTLTNRVELNLIAVPLAGIARANLLRLLPRFLPWIRPLNGMASSSGYQRMIEHLRLPGNVEVNVFAGDQDSVFKHSTKKYRALVSVLHGTLHVFPNATHMSALEEVARLR
jgi:pimeloyl-ACP methyl ester carboxylesterase